MLFLKSIPIYNSFSDSSYTTRIFCSLQDDIEYFTVKDVSALSTELFPMNFIQNRNSQQFMFLKALKVRELKRSEYFSTQLLKRADDLFKTNTTAFTKDLVVMLTELPSLVEEDKTFVNILRLSTFIPSNGVDNHFQLFRAEELYDPEDKELRQLLSDSFFPFSDFQREDILVFLRSLGLKTSLDWSGIILCAKSIEQLAVVNIAAQRIRGASLLRFLDKNANQLFLPPSNKTEDGKSAKRSSSSSSGFSLKKLLFGLNSEKPNEEINKLETVKSTSQYIVELCQISWIPVLVEPPDMCMPWPRTINSVERNPLASARETRPISDAWLCSASLYLCDCPIYSNHLLIALGWANVLDHNVIAVQLRELSVLYEIVLSNRTREISDDNLDINLSGTTATVDYHQKLRERITALIPNLYQSLNSVALQKKIEIVDILQGVDWIWIGNSFVSPSRVSFSSPINISPYLYLVPQDLAVYSYLLKIFGVRQSFSARDYVDVLQRMAADTGVSSSSEGSVLSDEQLSLAISLIALLSSEGSGIDGVNIANQTIYMPDFLNRLAPSSSLVIDDVPWLSGPEYSSVRAGIRFLHPNVAAKFALNIGVKSLRMHLVDRSVEQIFLVPDSAIEAFGQVRV